MNNSERSPWTAFRTTDVDEAHAHLSAAYMEIRVRRSTPARSFSLTTEIARLSDAMVGRAEYRARTRLVTVPFEDPCFVQLSRGVYRVAGPRDDSAVSVAGALLLLPHRRLDVRVDDFCLTTVTLPRELVDDVAHSVADVPAGVPVRFESARPLSRAVEQHWLSSVAYVERTILAHRELAGNALITGQAQRVLAAAALVTFPNTTMREAGREPLGEVSRAAVRRAVDFIDANPARDLPATEIAAAARVAGPSLLQAFRRYLGTTPTAYLRRARLELAHRDLGEADVGSVSVMEVARRWGFLDARRFAAEYRRAFGRSPTETLRS